MERIDFSRAEAEGSDYIKTAAEGFVDDGIFLREEIDAVDFDRVTGFFRTDLGKRCAEAYRKGLLERERPFDLMTDYAGERVIVQGIMELIDAEEALGHCFVIAPMGPLHIGRTEKNVEKLTKAYREGYFVAEGLGDKLAEYLSE